MKIVRLTVLFWFRMIGREDAIVLMICGY